MEMTTNNPLLRRNVENWRRNQHFTQHRGNDSTSSFRRDDTPSSEDTGVETGTSTSWPSSSVPKDELVSSNLHIVELRNRNNVGMQKQDAGRFRNDNAVKPVKQNLMKYAPPKTSIDHFSDYSNDNVRQYRI